MREHKPRSLFNELLIDWGRYSASPTAREAIARWTRGAGPLSGVGSPDELVATLRDPDDLDGRDERMLALLRLARDDADARRVILQALWPGLLSLTTIYGRPWDYEDTASTVVQLALERIADYPLHRTQRTAANIIRDVQHQLHRVRLREERSSRAIGSPLSLDVARELCGAEPVTASEELIELVAEAVRTKRISVREARLIVLRRVFDTPTAATATEEGRRPGSVRKARERAEARLARMATTALPCAG